MNDLIDRQAAISLAKDLCVPTKDGTVYRHRCIDPDAIRELPSAKPEITHCAECIHWKHSAVRKSYCEVFDWTNTAEDFCSFAERRTDDQRRSSKHN